AATRRELEGQVVQVGVGGEGGAAVPQIQEGLSPNHLKKAKLMFFYARYPSSNMLKMFFSDVK
ncbi:hypothetical protein CRUP_036716, partial [Coryphaenoides rupestris]